VRRLITIAIVVLALVLGLWFLLQGANRPPDPYFRGPVGGFGRQAFSIESLRIQRATGNAHCALLAVTDAQISRGLMGRRDLGGYDAMIFRFASDTSGPFTMRNTLIPLSIAWFDASGRLVDQAEMEPCPDRISCPSYYADAPYRYALETRAGGLGALGVGGPDTHLTLGGTCA
jgi:uncharacterized membrane protein (UPF0127 family)